MIYNPNLLYGKKEISSVINDGSDVYTSFKNILEYFDPNKSKNFKTSILDCSFSNLFIQERDFINYKIEKSQNLQGTILEKKFDVIVYEPPKNKNFINQTVKSAKTFKKILKPQGIVIIKINDFKEKNSNQLQGSFEIWDILSDQNFYLSENIIYNFPKCYNKIDLFDRSELNHLNFMIFKNKQTNELPKINPSDNQKQNQIHLQKYIN